MALKKKTANTKRNQARREAAKQKRFKRELTRVGEYLISGGAYFVTGYLIFFLCDKGLGWSLWWAKITASVAGWTVNYMLQRFWVFKDARLEKHRVEVTGRYTVITLVNFVLDYFIVFGLQVIGITPYIGQFISAAFFTVWNYLWYKMWVFSNYFPHGQHGQHHRRAS